MKKAEIEIGGEYLAKVSGKVMPVRITDESRFGGWDAVNRVTNRTIRIRSAARLRMRLSEAEVTEYLCRVIGV